MQKTWKPDEKLTNPDCAQALHFMDNLIKRERTLRDEGEKPGSVLPEVLMKVREFLLAEQFAFNDFKTERAVEDLR